MNLFNQLKVLILRHASLIKGGTAMLMLMVWFVIAVPDPLFKATYSTILLDRDGHLLSARVAADDQWRFPLSDSLPDKYTAALITSEDRNFFIHQGVYGPSLAKAFVENIRAGKIKRGGSTITMQVIRMSQGNPPRTIMQKVAEIFLALRLEITMGKMDILQNYAAHAPFGSNVVGLEAASWRYFGKSPHLLSWAESATLAVLPNNPGMIYPGRNQLLLKQKRDLLLRNLHNAGFFNAETLELAMLESLPGTPAPLPDLAPHLLNRLASEGFRGERCRTTLVKALQMQATELATRHSKILSGNEIHHIALLILDTKTGATLAYVGNSPPRGRGHGHAVDIIPARRSSGSILKPFLYAMMLDDGLILPEMLVRDVPVQIGNFRPLNYGKDYRGAIPAWKALSRSLNIPAVLMLKTYGIGRFCDRMRNMGMSTLERPSTHYGLSVILGGAESRLWELCGFYASMGRTLIRFSENDGQYMPGDFHPPMVYYDHWIEEKERSRKLTTNPEMLHASSIWLTFNAMKEVARPDEEANWSWFSSKPAIAWKTGTSFGNRDAWSVGVSPDYVVGVWAGNASGEGRPALTGTGAAAPLMFDLFSRLDINRWFDTPWDDLVPLRICRHSGHPPNEYCQSIDTILAPRVNLKVPPCPYHRRIHLDPSLHFQVNSSCSDPLQMIHQSWFVLPPAIEYYFKPLNPFYKSLPPFRHDCLNDPDNMPVMEIIYPVNMGEISIPIDISGQKQQVIFEVAHHNKKTKLYWYIDEKFLGVTQRTHKLSAAPDIGWHTLTVTDELGHRVSRKFKIK